MLDLDIKPKSRTLTQRYLSAPKFYKSTNTAKITLVIFTVSEMVRSTMKEFISEISKLEGPCHVYFTIRSFCKISIPFD